MFAFFQAYYFDRDDVALKGFSKFFKDSAEEEREHAEKFMKYQNMRGGRVVLQSIQVLFCQSLHDKNMFVCCLWYQPRMFRLGG